MRTLLLLLTMTSTALADPQIVNLLQFQAGNVDSWERAQRKSDSLPLTLAELEKLAAAGIAEKAIIEMMRTRKVLTVASADNLIKLKTAGASDGMIAALSAYAVAPNDGFDLALRVDVKSPKSVHLAPYLYVEVWHVDKNRQEAMLHADLRGLFAQGKVVIRTDRTDPLLPDTVRTVRFQTRVSTRHAGRLELRVRLSQTPGLLTLTNASVSEGITTYPLTYPAVSLESRCKLDLSARRDELLADRFGLTVGRLDCRWD